MDYSQKQTAIRVKRNFLGVSAQYVFGISLLMICNIVLARKLSVEDFGKFAFSISVAYVLSIPVTGGLTVLLTREVARYAQSGNWPAFRGLMGASYRWIFTASGVLYLAFFVLSTLLSIVPPRTILISLLLIPLMATNEIRVGMLRGLGRPLLAESSAQILHPILLLSCYTILFVHGDATAELVLIGYLLVTIIVVVINTFIVLQVLPRSVRSGPSDSSDLKSWRKTQIPLTLMTATNLLSTQVSILIVGFMAQDQIAGYLKIAERGAMLIIIPLHVAAAIIGPHLMHSINSSDIHKQRSVVRHSARLMTFSSLPLLIILACFGHSILTLVFGEAYGVNAHVPMLIMAGTQVFLMLFGNAGLMLIMAGRERLMLVSQLLALGINILLCIILITPFGAIGAAIGVSIGTIFATAMNVFMVRKIFGFVPGIFLQKSS